MICATSGLSTPLFRKGECQPLRLLTLVQAGALANLVVGRLGSLLFSLPTMAQGAPSSRKRRAKFGYTQAIFQSQNWQRLLNDSPPA